MTNGNMKNAFSQIVAEETNLALTIMESIGSHAIESLFDQPRSGEETNFASYYQKMHDEVEAYAYNNWLVPHLSVILATKPLTLIEIGCGNGRATLEAANHVEYITAIDWAKSSGNVRLANECRIQAR